MDSKTYIKALCSNNIYINDYKTKTTNYKTYAVFTIPYTAFNNNPELVPTTAIDNNNYIGCSLKATQTRKDYFCVSPVTKDLYIGKRNELEYWSLLVDISSFKLTYSNHKLSWTPYSSSYEGSVVIGSFNADIATNIYGSQLYNYEDCCVINGLNANTKNDWFINTKHSTRINYVYLVNETINICNIFKRTISDLINKTLVIFFYKDIDTPNYEYPCICGYSNSRKHFLERYNSETYTIKGNNIRDYSTIDISEAFDSLFDSDIAKEFNYTKDKFIQDFESSSNYIDLYSMFYTYRNSIYDNKYFTITRSSSSRHKPYAVVTRPDGSTTTLLNVTVKGRTYTIYTTQYNNVDKEVLLGLYKLYVDGTYTNVKIEFDQ